MMTILLLGFFLRKGSEKATREYLIKNNYTDTIIELAKNTFKGLKESIIATILKKNRKKNC